MLQNIGYFTGYFSRLFAYPEGYLGGIIQGFSLHPYARALYTAQKYYTTRTFLLSFTAYFRAFSGTFYITAILCISTHKRALKAPFFYISQFIQLLHLFICFGKVGFFVFSPPFLYVSQSSHFSHSPLYSYPLSSLFSYSYSALRCNIRNKRA